MTMKPVTSTACAASLACAVLLGFPASMNAASTPQRKDIEDRYKWDLTPMYASAEAWTRHYQEIEAMVGEFAALRGKCGESAATLLRALQLHDQLGVQLEKLVAYATMRHHEDMREPALQASLQRAQTLAVKAGEASAWFQPEVLQIPEDKLKAWLRQDDLKLYAHFFDDLLRSKAHILSPREEELLAMSAQSTEASSEVFSLLSNTELRWRPVKDPDGKDVQMTEAAYYQSIYSTDRRYRRDAFVALHESYLDVKDTLAATLAGAMHRDWFYSKARHYGSSLERSLDAENLPTSVYHNLIRTINARLPLLHRYVALKKKLLKLDELHFYDMYVKLVDVPDRQYSFDEGRDLVLAGIKPFGEEYSAVMKQAFDSRWIDVFENQGKISGAYNMGTYLSDPYLLLNYTGTFNDVSTLGHELGHAMQSHFSRHSQPAVYAGYPMFTAEVASTAAEIVFKRFMLQRATNAKERAFLVNQMLENIRGTVFRQTQFAEFELAAHELAEKGEPLTAEALMKINRDIYQRYYGPDLVLDPQLDVECLRIPHYYRNFYVYRYATSLCAAVAIANRIFDRQPGAGEDWMRFLKTGNSLYAIDMLKVAGVDMTTSKPVEETMTLFGQLLDELEKLLAEKADAASN